MQPQQQQRLPLSHVGSFTLRVWLRQALPGHQMHDCGLARGQPQGRQGHVAVQEPALVDQPQDLRRRHLLVRPIYVRIQNDDKILSCSYSFGLDTFK